MRWWLLPVLAMACARAPLREAQEPVPPPRPEVWVDGSASEGGDGTKARPFKTLEPRSGHTMHLATGLYEVSGTLADDVTLEGEGKAVVLHGDGLVASRATLKRLAIQGGDTGLTVRGAVTLEDVSFSGQRQAAVNVEPTGVLVFTRGELLGSVPEVKGVVTAGRASLTQVRFRGNLRHGVKVDAGETTVTDSSSEGPATAVHVSGGRAVVTRLRAVYGRGPAFSATASTLELHDVEVVGHEYAVLTGLEADLLVDGLQSDRAQVGAVGLVGTKAVLKHVVALKPGSHGAIESLEGETRVEDLTVTDATEVAVVQRHGRLDATKVRINGVRSEGGSGGDGIMVRDAVAVLKDVRVMEAGGTGVVATAVATVELDGLTCERCAHGALLVERRSTVNAKGVVSIGAREAAVSVPDDGVLELDGLDVSGSALGVWAECSVGSRVVLKGKLPARELLSGRCLELPPAPVPRSSSPR